MEIVSLSLQQSILWEGTIYIHDPLDALVFHIPFINSYLTTFYTTATIIRVHGKCGPVVRTPLVALLLNISATAIPAGTVKSAATEPRF